MRKLILIILPMIYLGACTEPAPPPPPRDDHHHHVKKSSDKAEDFRAVEKPQTYDR